MTAPSQLLIICDSLPGALTSTAPMVESLGREFERRGWGVTTTGIGSEPHVRGLRNAVYSRRLKSERLVVRALAEALAGLRLAFKVLWAIRTGRIPRPSVVVLMMPSLFLCVPAAIVRWATRARLYLVQRDLYPDWMIESGRVRRGLATELLFALKHFSLAQADYVGVECEENYRFIPERFRAKVGVLNNWREFGDGARAPARAGAGRTTLVYGGRMGVVQGFDRFLAAFLSLRRHDVLLTIYCDERGRAELGSQFGDVDRLPNVEVRPMLPEQDFLRAAASADFGVVTLSPQMKTHNIPGKVLGYVAAGLPVIAIGPSGAALGRVVRRLGIGYYEAEEPAAAISAALDAAAAPASMRQLADAVRQARRVFAVSAAADEILRQLASTVPAVAGGQPEGSSTLPG